MIKVIIFDFDGVIADSVDIKTKAFGELFEEEGGDIAGRVVDYHLKNTGVSRYDKFRYIYKNMLKRELSDEKFRELCSRFEALVAEMQVDEGVRMPGERREIRTELEDADTRGERPRIVVEGFNVGQVK